MSFVQQLSDLEDSYAKQFRELSEGRGSLPEIGVQCAHLSDMAVALEHSAARVKEQLEPLIEQAVADDAKGTKPHDDEVGLSIHLQNAKVSVDHVADLLSAVETLATNAAAIIAQAE